MTQSQMLLEDLKNWPIGEEDGVDIEVLDGEVTDLVDMVDTELTELPKLTLEPQELLWD